MFCPCGDVILADTEDWQVPRCYGCSTEDDGTDRWFCNHCKKKPYACKCDKPDWHNDTFFRESRNCNFGSSSDLKNGSTSNA
jgi:hypothetical protein